MLITSSGDVSANVNRVIYFSIQSNTVCGDNSSLNQYRNQFLFNINNLSDVDSDVTLYLYTKNGTLITNPGVNDNGMASDIVPGTQKTISANSTVQYTSLFGYPTTKNLSCDMRPAYGKIVINSNHGLFMASGEYSAEKYLQDSSLVNSSSYYTKYQSSTIVVNGGNPF